MAESSKYSLRLPEARLSQAHRRAPSLVQSRVILTLGRWMLGFSVFDGGLGWSHTCEVPHAMQDVAVMSVVLARDRV